MCSNVFPFVAGVLLSRFVIAAPAEAPSLEMRAEVENQALRLRVIGLQGPGSLFIYGGARIAENAGLESVVFQTNVAVSGDAEVMMPNRVDVVGNRFFQAAFWGHFDPGSNMVYIPAGSFTMGSPESEPARSTGEGPLTSVTITRGYWIGRFEVTQGEFESLMGRNPSNFSNNPQLPVEQVDWYEAMSYCDALTVRERASGRLPIGYVYRLPTEAEWEYACRSGTNTPFHYGAGLHSGDANFQGEFEYPPCEDLPGYCTNPVGMTLNRTALVGSYAPNAWGLYDMHGNVFEWCMDWWAEPLPGGNAIDPSGPPETPPKVLRGGGWQSYAVDCRSAGRMESNPIHGNYDVGFRVVLAPKL